MAYNLQNKNNFEPRKEPYEHIGGIKLTGREKQVLRLLVKGQPYKNIAHELSISVKTVEFHSSKLLKKFQASDRFELADIYNLFESLNTRDH